MMEMVRKIFLPILVVLIFLSCAERKEISIAWLSDTHVGATTSVSDLCAAVRDINSLPGIDFTIISGDVTETGSDDELELAKTILDSLKKPYYIIPGNHDTKWSASGCTKFPNLWGSDKFSFKFKGYQFIGMHQGPVLRMGDGYFSPEDVRWLDEQLAKINKTQPLIFITHYPLNSSISNWYEVLDRLKKFNTSAILFGHGHANKVWDFEGVAGVMGRSTLRRNEKAGGYNIVKIYSDSICFCEQITSQETKNPWHVLFLEFKNYAFDATKHERPDFSVNENYPHVKTKWIYDTRNLTTSAPAVGEDLVFIGNSSGKIYCLSLSKETEKWYFQAGGAVYSTPDIAEGKVVFCSTDKNIYCLDIDIGKLVWKYQTQAPVVAAPKIENGIVYIGGSDGKFRAVNLFDGSLIWEFNRVQDFVETKPIIYQDKIIFGAWDSFLYALKIIDGQVVWKWSNGKTWKLLSPAACFPVAAHNKIFIAAPDRFLTAINAANGTTIWRSNRFKVREAIGISEDGNTIYAKCMNDSLLAVSAIGLRLQFKWVADCSFGYDINPGRLVEKNGTLFFGTQRGYVYAIQPETGKLKWKFRVGVALVNSVTAIDSNKVVISDMSGKIMLIHAGNNNEADAPRLNKW